MALSFAFTIAAYLLSLFYFKNYIDVSYIFDLDTITKILLITLGTWLPFALFKFIYANKESFKLSKDKDKDEFNDHKISDNKKDDEIVNL